MSTLIGLAVLVAVIAVQTIWTIWRVGNRPFEVRHADITMTVTPATGTVRLHGNPSPEQLAAIEDFVADWNGLLLHRYRWRIVRPL